MSIQGQGHILTLAEGHLYRKNNLLFSEIIEPFTTKFCMEVIRYNGKKLC